MTIDDLIQKLEKIKEKMTPEERSSSIGIQSPLGLVVYFPKISLEYFPNHKKPIFLRFFEKI
jgi:hypothetical protein